MSSGRRENFATKSRRQNRWQTDGSSTAYPHPLKLIFQKKMDLGVRLGVLLGFARSRRRLVPSLDFDHSCCVSRFWQFGRAPKLGRSQKSQNQKILLSLSEVSIQKRTSPDKFTGELGIRDFEISFAISPVLAIELTGQYTCAGSACCVAGMQKCRSRRAR